MKRNPSIHIREDHLKMILLDVLNVDITDKQVKEILIKAKKYALNNRKLLASNAKTTQKAGKLAIAKLSDVEKFARILLLIRRQLKHRGIGQLRPGDSYWLMLKGITKNALEFSKEFSLSKPKAFKAYIEIGMSKMQKFSVNKLVNMYPIICEVYEANDEILKDSNKQSTEIGYDLYRRILIDKTGNSFDYKSIPEKYVYFVKAAEVARRLKTPIKTYIMAQFVGMSWRNAVPDPAQLVGPKAEERLNKYQFESNDKVVEKKAETIIDKDTVNFLKNLRNL